MTDNQVQPLFSRTTMWLLVLLLALLWFAQLDLRHLVPSDEGRYAEMAREMLRTGDWITPRYNGYKYFEKPPLQTWFNAITFALFGLGDWQARLYTALTGFFGILVVGFTGRRVFGAGSGPNAGLFAALALAAAPYWNLLGHFNTLDMGLSFMMALTLCSLLLAQRPNIAAAEVRNWMWLCWASMALAVLSKGLIGIVLPGATLVLYSLIARDWALWKRLYLVSGLLIFLVIAAPWFVLVDSRNPEFFDFFFINEHFRRFLTPSHHRTGPLLYFVPVLLVGFLPWLSVALQSFVRGVREPRPANRFSPGLMLLVWSGFIFFFFSISESKLISYTLPIAPALALLIGAYLPRLTVMQVRRHLLAYAALLPLAAAGVAYAIYVLRPGDDHTPYPFYAAYGVFALTALALLLVGTLIALWVNRQGTNPGKPHAAGHAIFVFGAAWIVATSVAGNGHEVFGLHSSGALLVPDVKAEMKRLPADTPFYMVDVLDHTMPFYLRHTMIAVQNPDELDFGVHQEPQKWIPTLAQWKQVWLQDRDALALMPPALYDKLQAQHLPMQVIARDERRVIVAKPQAQGQP